MITPTPGSNRIRKMLADLHNEEENILSAYPTMGDVIGIEWTSEEIKYYMRLETDNRRLAKWCQIFLELPY